MIPYSLNPMGFGDPYMSDLDILRQIRDANPTSQLPSLWLDSEDPYTQWEGVAWLSGRVIATSVLESGIQRLPNINKLTELQDIAFEYSQLTDIDLSGLTSLKVLLLSHNKLSEIPSLTSKGLITNANFTNNLMLTPETNRLLAMGFTTDRVLPQDI